MSIEKVSFSPEGFQRLLSALKTRFGSAGDSMVFSMAKEFGVYDSQQMLSLLNENDEYIVKVTRKTKEAQRNAIQNLMNSMMYDNADHNWGHRDTIINPHYNMVSIVIAYNYNTIYLVQDFEANYIEE